MGLFEKPEPTGISFTVGTRQASDKALGSFPVTFGSQATPTATNYEIFGSGQQGSPTPKIANATKTAPAELLITNTVAISTMAVHERLEGPTPTHFYRPFSSATPTVTPTWQTSANQIRYNPVYVAPTVDPNDYRNESTVQAMIQGTLQAQLTPVP